MFCVEALGDLALAMTVGGELKDSSNGLGFRLVDALLDMRPGTVRVEYFDVVVTEASAAGDVPSPRFAHRRVGDTLPCFVALELVGERGQRQEDFVRGRLERPLAVFKVEEHPDAGGHELFERIRRFDRLTSE